MAESQTRVAPEEEFDGRDRPDDAEFALRLFIPDWLDGYDLTGAAFRTAMAPTLWIRDRLPDKNGELLHRGTFATYGRASIAVGDLRATRFLTGGIESSERFDLAMTPELAGPPLDEFAPAHACLVGPYNRKRPKTGTPASKLADQFNQFGTIERWPAGVTWRP